MSDKYFPKVKEARAKLAEKAVEIFDLQVKIINAAINAGNYDVAQKAIQFLMEHMPREIEGGGMVDSSVDTKTTEKAGPVGPQIQIGIALGGVKTKELPPVEVIDITPKVDSGE